MRSIIIVFLFVLGFTGTTLAQKFNGEANLPGVETDGFYRVFISPQISAYFNPEFSNVRIFDQKDQEVPYLFQKEEPTYYSEQFKIYEIIEKKQEKNCCTSLILQNPDSRPINNISLSIKNAEVTKQATLLGSDDKENWFALKQHFAIYSIDNKNETSEIKIVDFPLSNYTYYLLRLEDSTSAPINILSAGYYEAKSENGKYTGIATFHVIKSDSAKEKRSYIQIVFDTVQVIDKLTIAMSGQPYFLRRASINTKEERKNKKGKVSYYYKELYNFELSSKQPSVIVLPGIKVDNLVIWIENEDNPSLDLASLETFQLNRYLTAWLKKGNQYSVKIGESNLRAPVYDLAFFQDKIPATPAVLTVGPVMIFGTPKADTSFTLFTSQSIIWIAIVLVIVILGFMSIRLIKETNAAKK